MYKSFSYVSIMCASPRFFSLSIKSSYALSLTLILELKLFDLVVKPVLLKSISLIIDIL